MPLNSGISCTNLVLLAQRRDNFDKQALRQRDGKSTMEVNREPTTCFQGCSVKQRRRRAFATEEKGVVSPELPRPSVGCSFVMFFGHWRMEYVKEKEATS